MSDILTDPQFYSSLFHTPKNLRWQEEKLNKPTDGEPTVGGGKNRRPLRVNKVTGTGTNGLGINPGWKRHHPGLEVLVILDLRKKVIHTDTLNERHRANERNAIKG